MALWRRARRRESEPGGMAPPAGRSRSLKRKLAIATAVGGLCTLVLAALVMARSYGDFTSARQNLYDISAYRELLDAANVLSAERGPATACRESHPRPTPPRANACKPSAPAATPRWRAWPRRRRHPSACTTTTCRR